MTYAMSMFSEVASDTIRINMTTNRITIATNHNARGGGHDEQRGHDTNARCDGNRGAVGRGLPAHSSPRAFTPQTSRPGAWWLLLQHQTKARFRALHLALVLGLARNLVVGDRGACASTD